MNEHPSAALLGLLLLSPVGCGGPSDSLPRQAVSGSVTFEDEPLAEGMIVFQPKASQETAIQVASPIENGRYRIPKHDGPVPGEYVVSISATNRGSYVPSGNPEEEDPSAQITAPATTIPARYNIASELSASISAGETNTVDFELDAD